MGDYYTGTLVGYDGLPMQLQQVIAAPIEWLRVSIQATKRIQPTHTWKASRTTTQWPPRSPYEALLSSPSGRKRVREIHDRRSVSPSPCKRVKVAHTGNDGSGQSLGVDGALAVTDASDEDEDEETLQLRLQAIEAKLKLKKLRQARLRNTPAKVNGDAESSKSDGSKTVSVRHVQQPSADAGGMLQRAHSLHDVQIPLSPLNGEKQFRTTNHRNEYD